MVRRIDTYLKDLLSGEQFDFYSMVRDFSDKEIAPRILQWERDKSLVPDERIAKMAEMGLFGIFVSPEYGGSGLDYVSYIIAVEELARIDGSQAATVAAGNSLGIGPIYYFGNEEQKQKWLHKDMNLSMYDWLPYHL